MPRTIASLFLCFVLFAGLDAAAQSPATWFVKFAPSFDQHPESIALDSAGNAYTSSFNTFPVGKLIKVTPDARAYLRVVLPAGDDLGVTTDRRGDVYVLVNATDPANTGLWRLAPYNAAPKLVANLPDSGLLNALAFDYRGNTYITDSFKPNIYRVDENGQTTTWVHDPANLGGVASGPCGTFPAAVGANGIALFGNTVYVLNTTQGKIIRYPIESDGSAGPPSLLAGPTCELWGLDGQAFDILGNLYVAVNIQNKIVKVDRYGELSTIASAPTSPLNNPTGIAFGATPGLETTIFITNATLFLPNAQAGIVELNVGIPGLPLP